MKSRSKIKLFNHFIIIFIASFCLVDVILNNKISYDFELIPDKIFALNELWRLFTYPFTYYTIESSLLFLFTALLLIPFLETKFRKTTIGLLFFLVILLQGILFSIIFKGNDFILKGTDGISFFIITLYLKNNLSLKQFQKKQKIIHLNVFVILISLSWLATIFIHSKFIEYEILIPSLFSLFFGISTGLLFDLIVKVKYIITSFKKSQITMETVSYEEEFMLAEISKHTKRQQYNQIDNNIEFDSDYFSEDRLNQILDKINTEGKQALTDEEIKYLHDYSKNL